jgi:membrane associated rhomboid family serine protease
MSRYETSDEHQPLLWLGGHGLYATHVLVIGFVLSCVVTALMSGTGIAGPLAWLPFDSTRVLKGEFWRVFTYGFVNPPSLWFAIDMLMLFWFGRELEKFFGRRTFLKFYAGLYLLPPVLFTLIGLWRPMGLAGSGGSFALFIGFATLYPNAVLLFNLLAKWVALILIALYTLIAISDRNLVAFLTLATTTSFAWAFVRHAQGRLQLPSVPLPRRSSPPADLSPRRARTAAPAPSAEDFMAVTDTLLDKIARDGIGSLTPAERRHLDEARERLKQRRS